MGFSPFVLLLLIVILPAQAGTPGLWAKVVTSKGEFKVELFQERAPQAVEHFVVLARRRKYNGARFERYVAGYALQLGKSKALPEVPSFPDERGAGSQVVKGALGFPWNELIDGISSNFFIALAPRSELAGRLVIFGQVVEGFEVLAELRPGDKIKKVVIEKK